MGFMKVIYELDIKISMEEGRVRFFLGNGGQSSNYLFCFSKVETC